MKTSATGKIYLQRYQTPVGDLVVGSYGNKLCICDWVDNIRREQVDKRLQSELNAVMVDGLSPVIERTFAQLDEYFAGTRKEFDIPLVFAGSEFQCRVWQELMNIPYGTSISYAEEARRIGNPKAVRAVANANAVNAISIIVPCHRVVGSNNKLVGYGGGLNVKSFLLQLESKQLTLFDCNSI